MKPTFTSTTKKTTSKIAIWSKLTKQGKPYLSVKVIIEGKEYNLAAFKNEKKSENSPDYTGD